ncbi:Cof-type HAD-IIB family hydrolase [Limosilactobacillus caecicola]|uniref:Cof-type HAD-IIB family hydrolase n=1 Tax=Limosilactobacillus caecicola TaxID=2941332 RepID=UPI00203D88AB|nr:Cof-type HAD-IIB family hydrolase [Limosilactobacillus caecicola]
MIKMIALDLDNTLLNSDKEISPRNEKILRQLHQAGIKVVLCTGRPINAIWNYIEQLGLTAPDDFTINFNGGLVVNNVTKQPLFSMGLKAADLKLVFDFAHEHDYSLDVLDFNRVYEIMDMPRGLYKGTVKHIEFVDAKFAELPQGDHPYAKMVMAIPAERLKKIIPTIPVELREYFTVVQSQPHILEYLPKGVDKATGLKHLLDHFGLDFSNLMTFGDADNDLGMIKAAGDGVVMANGLPEVKAVADHLTTSNDEDGVADYLEKKFATLL